MGLQETGELEFFHATDDITSIISKRFLLPWIQPDILFRMSRYYNTFCSAVNIMNKKVNEVKSRHVFFFFFVELMNNNILFFSF